MHFSVQNDVLCKALKDVTNAVAARVVQPILSSVLVESTGESSLRFTGTDLDLSIEFNCPGVINTPGSVALPGKRLAEIVSRLPSDLVEFRVDSHTQETMITCSRSKFVLSGLPSEDFPKPTHADASAEGIIMPAEVLRRAIQLTFFAAAAYETGSILSGVYLQLSDGIFEVTATDGSRLANRKEMMRVGASEVSNNQAQHEAGKIAKNKMATLEKPKTLKAIVPVRACNELIKLIDAKESNEARISQTEGTISFETGSHYLSTRLVGGEYPRYQELLPTEYTYLSTLKRKEILEAIDRVSIMSDERTRLIKLHFEGDTLHIAASTPDVGRAQEEIPMKFEGQVLDISLNVRYMQEVLQRMDNEEVKLEMNGPLRPIIIKGADEENYQYLLMPVQSK